MKFWTFYEQILFSDILCNNLLYIYPVTESIFKAIEVSCYSFRLAHNVNFRTTITDTLDTRSLITSSIGFHFGAHISRGGFVICSPLGKWNLQGNFCSQILLHAHEFVTQAWPYQVQAFGLTSGPGGGGICLIRLD